MSNGDAVLAPLPLRKVLGSNPRSVCFSVEFDCSTNLFLDLFIIYLFIIIFLLPSMCENIAIHSIRNLADRNVILQDLNT